jgi:hypothetical protein
MRVGDFGPKRKTQVELLRCASPQDGCEFQEPGSHNASSPIDGAMQGQGEIDFDEVYRVDRPAGDNLGVRMVDPDRSRDIAGYSALSR